MALVPDELKHDLVREGSDRTIGRDWRLLRDPELGEEQAFSLAINNSGGRGMEIDL